MTRKRIVGGWFAPVLVLAMSLVASGCTKITMVTDYDQQFDNQLTEFQNLYNTFVFKVLLSGNAAEAAYGAAGSQTFYYQTVPEQMTKLVNRAVVGSLQKPTLPIPVWNKDKEKDCDSVVSLDCTQRVVPSLPTADPKTPEEFAKLWDTYRQFVFAPLCTDNLVRCCPKVGAGNIALSLGNTNTTSLCLLNYLWDNLSLLAKAQWRADQKGKRMSLADIQLTRAEIQTSFRMLALFEQQKRRTGETTVDK